MSDKNIKLQEFKNKANDINNSLMTVHDYFENINKFNNELKDNKEDIDNLKILLNEITNKLNNDENNNNDKFLTDIQ